MVSNKWRASVLPVSATLHQAIQQLDASGLQIIIGIEEDDVLAGTVTDGDIRRGLLRGVTLDSSIQMIMNRAPFLAPPGLPVSAMREIMRANKIRQLPVVDDQRRVVGLHVWDELERVSRRENLLVVMAGGRGVRLLPHTENCPKPMLPVGGKPMLEHIIERARSDGFERFVIAIHYLGHVVEDYFGDGARWGVGIEYLREQAPLGTGGALGLMTPPERPFVVTNGDVLSDVRYGDILDFHEKHAALATMAVQSHELQHPFGVVRIDGVDIVGFEEKPIFRSHVNAGIYAFSPAALQALQPNQHCDMPALFEQIRASGHKTIAYPMHEPWLDVGRPADLDRAQKAHSAV